MALQAVAKGGTVVCGGIHMSDIPAFPYRLLWQERSIVSVANLTPWRHASDSPPIRQPYEPPEDPLVQRRDANKQASDQYKAKKKAAKTEYNQSVKSAKQDKSAEKKANDAKMKQEMSSTPADAQKN